MSCYDTSKRAIAKRWQSAPDLGVELAVNVVASIAITLAMQPFDVVATRLFNQEVVGGRGKYVRPTGTCLIVSCGEVYCTRVQWTVWRRR